MHLSAESLRTEAPSAVLSGLAAGLLEAGRRGDPIVVLELSGEGDGSPGGVPATGSPGDAEGAAGEMSSALDSYRRRGGILAACTHGRVSGLLVELALVADLHLASEAARFVLPGLFDDYLPCLGAWTRLVGRVGSGRARSLLLCPGEGDGAGLSASAALAAGVCDAVIATGRMTEAVDGIRKELERSSADAVMLAGRLGGRKRGFGFLTARQERLLEMASFSLCFASDHPREGIAAFFEGRRPQFHSTKDER